MANEDKKDFNAMLHNVKHTFVQKGRTNIRYYVKDYEQVLFTQ